MIRTSLCMVAALSCFQGALAKDYLEAYLPESTLVSISLEDTSSLFDAIENGQLSKLVSEEQKETWLEYLNEPYETGDGNHFKLPSGEELSNGNLNELLNGRICFSIISLEGEDNEPSIVLLADFAGEIDALKFLQIADREAAEDEVLLIEETYAGITLFTEELADDSEDEWMPEYWALVDGIAIETTSMELLKNTVDAIIDSRRDGLASTADFHRAIDLSSGAPLLFFGNLRAGIELFQKYLSNDMGDLPMNPLAVTTESMWNSLALDSLGAVFIGIDFESENIESIFGILYEERKGLLSLLAYSQNAIHYPHWIPSNAVASTVSMIDFPEVFANFESIMNAMSPNFSSMFQLQLDNFRQQSDIDMRESLMKNFGDQYISFTVWEESEDEDMPAIQNEQNIVAIPVRDPQAFQNAIKGLSEIFMPGTEVLSERKFLDLTIVTPANTGDAEPPFAYSLADGYLILSIGSVELLESTLYHMRESSDGLWDQTYIVDAMKQFPPNPVESGYYNLGTAIEELYKIYHGELEGNLGEDNDWKLPDLSEVDLPFYLISAGYIMEGAQVTRARILPKN